MVQNDAEVALNTRERFGPGGVVHRRLRELVRAVGPHAAVVVGFWVRGHHRAVVPHVHADDVDLEEDPAVPAQRALDDVKWVIPSDCKRQSAPPPKKKAWAPGKFKYITRHVRYRPIEL